MLVLDAEASGAVAISVKPLTLDGLGFNDGGALQSVTNATAYPGNAGTANSWAGTVTMNGVTYDGITEADTPNFPAGVFFNVGAGSTLNLTNTVNGGSDLVLNGRAPSNSAACSPIRTTATPASTPARCC